MLWGMQGKIMELKGEHGGGGSGGMFGGTTKLNRFSRGGARFILFTEGHGGGASIQQNGANAYPRSRF